MKAVILAGGLGTRLSEETDIKPKPMVEIGGMPILWHIMKIYSSHGINDFIICCGYKGYVIKEYFSNYSLHMSDVTIDLKNNFLTTHKNDVEPWKITLVDTGETAMTGGRLKAIKKYLSGDETFCLAYGDCLGNIDITKSISEHKTSGKSVTVTAVRPAARFGALNINSDGIINKFDEKPAGDGNWVNGGFFVINNSVINLIRDEKTVFENEILSKLAKDGDLNSYKHFGYWQPMDTLRDKISLNELWQNQNAPWKSWK